MDGLNKEGW